MRRSLPVVCLLTSLLAAAALAQSQPRAIAVTFDDLPYVSLRGDYLAGARRVTSALTATLDRYHAPAVAFVNERQLEGPERDARIGLLRQWLAHGAVLGNHTYSHPDFNALSVAAFEDDIVKGETTIRILQPRASPVFFRHPMTHTGDTVEKKTAVDRFLHERGYIIAPHTIENSDFIFNVVYVRALEAHDGALAARVRQAYLEFTDAATAFAESVTPKIFGRDIPQTLLIHGNDLNADCLDDLLRRYRQRGYRFISLEEAMADGAYKTPDTSVSTFGPTWLVRWSKSLGLAVSFAADPDPPKWVMDLYSR